MSHNIHLSPDLLQNSIPQKSNSSFVLHGVKDVKFEERELVKDEEVKLNDDEVLVSPRKTGICGSDVHFLLEGRIGEFVVRAPMILGHESSGIILKIGDKVKGLKPGDRVALEPGVSCLHCDDCKRGHYELCPDMVFAATPPIDGTLQARYRLRGDLAYKLPDNMLLEEGAMIEPLSVAVQAVAKVGDIRGGWNVAVFGAGPVGLLCMAVAKALGARKVYAFDIQKERLDFAKSYAADEVFQPGKPNEGESKVDYSQRTAKEISSKLGIKDRGLEGVDLVLECSGAEVCIQTGLFLAKFGGTFVQVGMGSQFPQIPILTTLSKEILVKGSFRYGHGAYATSIDLVSRGLVQLKPLITHRYTFKEAEKAFKTTQDGKGEDGRTAIKTIIDGPVE